MADVDAFTQRMLDRARQRRENLDKKMAETTPRKRPGMPLSENQQSNIRPRKNSKDDEMVETVSGETSHGVGKLTVHLSSPQCSRLAADDDTSHDSPNKKYCMRLEEPDVKPDTPAIPSVRSRLHGLAALRSHDDDRMDVDPPAKPRRAPAPPRLDDEEYEPKPATRRNRLAALAQTINTWEDDLSRPTIKQEEKPKKVWQPPRAPAAPEPAQPSKPPRTYEYSKNNSPTKAQASEERTTDFMKRIAPTRGASPVKFSPSKANVEERSPVKTTIAKNSPVKTKYFPSPKPVVSTMTVNLANTPSPGKSGGYSRDEIKKPVSSTLASWQKKSTEDTPEEPTKQPVSARKAIWENKVQATSSNTFKAPTASTNPSKSPHKEPRRDLFDVSMHDPLNMSVHSRMGVWEKKVDESQKEKDEHIKSQQILKAKSPVKGPGPRSTADFKNALTKKAGEMQTRGAEPSNMSVSPMKSPAKVGKATKELHARLTKMDTNWKNNEIAEKIKQQKESDMAVLQNRWKNGVLCDDVNDECVTTSNSQGVPAPPPPPPTAAPRRASPQKSAPKTPKNERREEARDKIRAEPGAVQSLGSLISTEGKNFEQKLCAMGFDVTPSKTATMDLTPIKQKEKANANQPKSPVRPKPAAILMEETKITTTRFGNDEKVHVSTKTYPVGNHTSSYNATLRTNGTPAAPSTPSIYNIIKKNSSNNTPRPTMGKLHDSFDSDDSFEESNRRQMPPPNRVQPPNTKVTVTTSVKRQDSMSSTQSETQSEYSEVTDTQDDYTEDYTEDDDSQYTEEDYSSEDESGADNQQLDDLLDEAMDDTEVTETETESEASAPIAPPRRSANRENPRQTRPISYHGSSSSKDSRTGSDSSTGNYDHLLRRPNETPAERETRRRRGVTFAEGTTPASSELSSAESEDEKPQVYSIDMYRSSWNHMKHQNKVTPKMTIVRHSEQSRRREQEDEPLPYVPEKSVRQKLQELQELVNQEQTVIQQTSNALNQCCGTNSMFAGSAEAVECHRLLLIACKKREAYITEMQHLRDGGGSTLGRQPQGSLTLSDIRLPLKREFMSKIGGSHDTTVHYFICMIRNGAHVVLTQMMSTHDAMVRDSLDFPNLIQLKDIKQNFRFDLEIYGMSVIREVDVNKTPKKQKKGLTPKKWLKGSTPGRSLQSPAGPTSVRSTNFVLVACLPINIKSVTKTHFSLDKVPYSSPLQGTIHLKLRCLMESTIIEKGFLTIFEDVSGFGAWHRRWFVLKNHTLSFWKYPDDEKIKDPIGYIDLKYCISEKIGLIPRDICARPNTFEILTVRRQQKGERDTLTSWVSNTVSTTRNMLSADTKEDRLAWCDRMNEALANVRSWSPEALRPIKVHAVEDPTKPLGGNKYQHMTNI